MSNHQTIAGLRRRHAAEERRLLLGALVGCEWSLTRTAERLDVAVSTVQTLIATHNLGGLYDEHAQPRDHPHHPKES